MSSPLSFRLRPQDEGKRFDVFAAEQFPTLSRAFVQKLIESGRIEVNGASQKGGYKLRTGDKIASDFNLEEIKQIPDIDLSVLYEDDNVLVVDKPTGLISHARGKYWDEPSVASFVRQKSGQIGERAGIVHRLDRATSGVMICAKNETTLSVLQKQFADRKVEKAYMAIIEGHITPTEAIIDMPIERNPKLPSTFRVGASGKSAQTYYKVTKSSNSYDLLRLEPKTGRTHQLRVHLTKRGHPIVGDNLYGGQPADRLFLHAHSLSLNLPDQGRRTFVSPLPKQFDELLKD